MHFCSEPALAMRARNCVCACEQQQRHVGASTPQRRGRSRFTCAKTSVKVPPLSIEKWKSLPMALPHSLILVLQTRDDLFEASEPMQDARMQLNQ